VCRFRSSGGHPQESMPRHHADPHPISHEWDVIDLVRVTTRAYSLTGTMLPSKLLLDFSQSIVKL
jgi:hypothetical protein